MEADDAVFLCVDRVVAAHECAFASALGRAGLADEDLASLDGLACVAFYAEAFAGAVADVFT